MNEENFMARNHCLKDFAEEKQSFISKIRGFLYEKYGVWDVFDIFPYRWRMYYYDYINNPIAEYYFNYHYIINFNNTHFTLNEIFANSSMTSSLPEAELTDLTHDFKFQSALKSDEAQYKPRQQSLQQLTYEQLINQHLRPHQQPQPTHQQPQQVREQAREQQARKQQENNN